MVVVIPTNSLQQLLNKNYVDGHTSSSRIGRIRRSHCRTLEDNSVSTAYVMADSNVFSYKKLLCVACNFYIKTMRYFFVNF